MQEEAGSAPPKSTNRPTRLAACVHQPTGAAPWKPLNHFEREPLINALIQRLKWTQSLMSAAVVGCHNKGQSNLDVGLGLVEQVRNRLPPPQHPRMQHPLPTARPRSGELRQVCV